MASKRLLEHFRNPANVGELAPPALRVEVVNPACGDVLRLTALVEEGGVKQVAYKVRGCPASIAAGSALTELMIGKTVAELRTLTAEDIEAALGGLDPESKHAGRLGLDALTELLFNCK